MVMEKFWRAVRAVQATLPEGAVYLASIADESVFRPGGIVSETASNVAAQRLVDKTHRLATDAEISAHKAAAGRARNLAESRAATAANKFVFERNSDVSAN